MNFKLCGGCIYSICNLYIYIKGVPLLSKKIILSASHFMW